MEFHHMECKVDGCGCVGYEVEQVATSSTTPSTILPCVCTHQLRDHRRRAFTVNNNGDRVEYLPAGSGAGAGPGGGVSAAVSAPAATAPMPNSTSTMLEPWIHALQMLQQVGSTGLILPPQAKRKRQAEGLGRAQLPNLTLAPPTPTPNDTMTSVPLSMASANSSSTSLLLATPTATNVQVDPTETALDREARETTDVQAMFTGIFGANHENGKKKGRRPSDSFQCTKIYVLPAHFTHIPPSNAHAYAELGRFALLRDQPVKFNADYRTSLLMLLPKLQSILDHPTSASTEEGLKFTFVRKDAGSNLIDRNPAPYSNLRWPPDARSLKRACNAATSTKYNVYILLACDFPDLDLPREPTGIPTTSAAAAASAEIVTPDAAVPVGLNNAQDMFDPTHTHPHTKSPSAFPSVN